MHGIPDYAAEIVLTGETIRPNELLRRPSLRTCAIHCWGMLSRLGACVLRCSPAPAPFSPVAAVLCPQGRFITTAAVTTHETQNVTRIERLMALSGVFPSSVH